MATRKCRNALGLAMLGITVSALAGCGPQPYAAPSSQYPLTSSPYTNDCLYVYNRSCGNPIRYDPIRDGHGG